MYRERKSKCTEPWFYICNNKRKAEEHRDETSVQAAVRLIKGCKNGETQLMHNEILFKL